MINITAVAIDDEPLALEVIKNFAGRINNLQLKAYFTKIEEATEYLRSHKVQLLFLDIHMPKVSGIDFVKNLDTIPLVIFSTAHSQYAVEGFELNATDYLLKPYSFERFEQAVEKAIDVFVQKQNAEQTNTRIFFKSNYGLSAIEIENIEYIESFGDNLTIHCVEEKSTKTRMALKAILKKLSTHDFVRVHRSYIVQKNKIKKIAGKNIYVGKAIIPIGVSYENEMNKLLKNYF